MKKGRARMDETAGVKGDIIAFLRDNHLEVGDPLHEEPFYTQKMVHYDAKQKAAFKAAVEELVAEGVLERRDDTVILTAKGHAAFTAYGDDSPVAPETTPGTTKPPYDQIA
jgi:hypothetical protein